MKPLTNFISRLFSQANQEIEEAPRFEDWYNQMFPKDTFNPQMEEFGRTMLTFKQEQKDKLTNSRRA
jgi:hypothetical protein